MHADSERGKEEKGIESVAGRQYFVETGNSF